MPNIVSEICTKHEVFISFEPKDDEADEEIEKIIDQFCFIPNVNNFVYFTGNAAASPSITFNTDDLKLSKKLHDEIVIALEEFVR